MKSCPYCGFRGTKIIDINTGEIQCQKCKRIYMIKYLTTQKELIR